MKIQFENVTFYYNHKLPDTAPCLKNINFQINDHEFIGIIGPSGSGKTTLIQHFTGLLNPSQGRIIVNDIDLSKMKQGLNIIRKKIGLVFQFPESQLFEETIYDDIAFGPKNFGLTEAEIEQRINKYIDFIGFSIEQMKARSSYKLSEGEKRRIALISTIVMEPEVLILDESTACLDPIGINRIEQLLKSLYKSGTTIILVSHNFDFILKLCQRVIFIDKGTILFDGLKDDFFENSQFLKNFKIIPPRILQFSHLLYQMGYLVKKNLYSVDIIKECLKRQE
jgi:energy-coupling factor transport system ATP-binding protein